MKNNFTKRNPFMLLKIVMVFMMAFIAQISTAQANHVVIYDIYGGGGNGGATYLNDYVVLFNPTNNNVDINGWSLQYGAAGTTTIFSRLNLPNATIDAGRYYLIQLAGAGSAIGTPLPTPDYISTSINMSSLNGKIYLVNDNVTIDITTCSPSYPTVIDFVGYGSSVNCYKGTAAPGASSATSITRKNNGCTDTNNNGNDFNTPATPAPKNSATAQNICPDITPPTVTITSTESGTTNLTSIPVTVTFSESVTGFVAGDITVSNGTVSSFAGSGASYTFNITPATSGAVTVNIVAGIAQDAAANNNTAAPQFSISYSNASKVIDVQCGSTIAALNSTISCDVVSGATQYKFEVTYDSTTAYYISNGAGFNLLSIPNAAAFDKVYSIRVATNAGGTFGPYGTACTITAPAEILTQVKASICGTTFASTGTIIYADAVGGNQGYRFEVSENNVFLANIDTNTGISYFRLTQLPSGTTYSKTYSIRVASFVNGAYTSFGTPCSITAPAAPVTKLTDALCNATLASTTTAIAAITVTGAQGYKFEVSEYIGDAINPTFLENIETTGSSYFRLTQLSAGTSL